MSSKKISELNEKTSLDNDDLIPIVDSAEVNLTIKTKKVKYSVIRAEIGNASTGGNFEAYNAATTYTGGETYYVDYNDGTGSNIYKFISATDQTGVTPGTDDAVWELVSVGEFAHEKDKDQYLDFGGANQVAASEIVKTSDARLVTNYATIAAMTAATPVDNNICYVEESGRGGYFIYDSASTATTNTGTIFQKDAGGNGRWLRIFEGFTYNVRWFNAKGDGTTDDTTAIQNALNLIATNRKGELYFPAGTYIYSAALTITGGTTPDRIQGFRMFGERGARLKQDAAALIASDLLLITNADDSCIENLIFEGIGTSANSFSASGFFVLHFAASTDRNVVRDVTITGYKNGSGIDHSGSGRSIITNNVILDTGYGIWQTNTNGYADITNNLIITTISTGSGSLSNGQGSIHTTSSPKCNISNNYISVGLSSIGISSSATTGVISNNVIASQDSTSRGISVTNSASEGFVIEGNQITNVGVGITLVGNRGTINGNVIIGSTTGAGTQEGIQLYNSTNFATEALIVNNVVRNLATGITCSTLAVNNCSFVYNKFASVTTNYVTTNATNCKVIDEEKIGLGTVIPSGNTRLHVSGTGGTDFIQFEGSSSSPWLTGRYWVSSANGGPRIRLFKGRGTKTSPSANASGDELGKFEWSGLDNAGTPAEVNSASLKAVTTEAWTTTARGTKLEIYGTRQGESSESLMAIYGIHGTPEGQISASPGTICTVTTSSIAAEIGLYVKDTGIGNTGWVKK